MNSVKEVFNTYCKDLVFDQKLLRKVQTYEQRFVNKNENHIAFFGGNLMGVHPVRFVPEDRRKWFDDIVGEDEFAIRESLVQLKDIDEKWHVSSDVMNLSCLWMIHRFLTEPKLTEGQRYDGAMAVALIMNYKFITSILADWFTWNADPIVAQTTYSMLSKRFGLKMAGSWGQLLRQRSHDIIRKGGLHYNTFLKFNDDYEIVKLANDVQGRIKSILKNIRDIFTMAQNSPELHIKNQSNTISIDGEIHLRDKTRLISQYRNYILSTISDRRAFIHPDLVDVVVTVSQTVPKKIMDQTLLYMVNNSSIKADPNVQALIEVVLQHSFDYLARNPYLMKNKSDLAGLMRKMKALYTAAKTDNELILEIRRVGNLVARNALGNKKADALISATRTAIALYILLRTMTMQSIK